MHVLYTFQSLDATLIAAVSLFWIPVGKINGELTQDSPPRTVWHKVQSFFTIITKPYKALLHGSLKIRLLISSLFQVYQLAKITHQSDQMRLLVPCPPFFTGVGNLSSLLEPYWSFQKWMVWCLWHCIWHQIKTPGEKGQPVICTKPVRIGT